MKALKHTLTPTFISQALQFADAFDVFCYLTPTSYIDNCFKHVLAIGSKQSIRPTKQGFEELQKLHSTAENTIFGYLGYDLKNEVENLTSKNTNYSNTNNIHFFEPQIVISFTKFEIEIKCENPEGVLKSILAQENSEVKVPTINYAHRTTKEEYYQNFQKIKQHLVEGDIYELNYCINFYNDNCPKFSPTTAFLNLNRDNAAPFSALYKSENTYIISSSPERFLQRTTQKVTSQPMKGTVKRSSNQKEDEQLKQTLINSDKEKSENLMIVDLVRHDLSHFAEPGTVSVDELFGIYSFPKVHQLISTVSMVPKKDASSIDILKKAFPMGSMTGAPKIKAMELIDTYENFQRNQFSGALGYIEPNGNFDFNVLIRTLLFNKNTNYLSFSAGSAITFDANAEDEYNECLLKAETLISSIS